MPCAALWVVWAMSDHNDTGAHIEELLAAVQAAAREEARCKRSGNRVLAAVATKRLEAAAFEWGRFQAEQRLDQARTIAHFQAEAEAIRALVASRYLKTTPVCEATTPNGCVATDVWPHQTSHRRAQENPHQRRTGAAAPRL